jgi:hypothetical protein
MLPMRDEILVSFITAERLDAAERARLLRAAIAAFDRSLSEPPVPRTRRLLAGTGHLLVRLGHWLECLGEDCVAARPSEVGEAVRA